MRFPLWALACTVLPGIAAAHTGDHSTLSFTAGFAHPLTGVDHLRIMLGLVAGRAKGAMQWLLSSYCLAVVTFGTTHAFANVPLPLVEVGIALSVLLTGVAVITRLQAPVYLAAALFALCHGYTHGAEIPAMLSSAAYGAGFLLGTTLLLAAGFGASLMRSTPTVQ
jgi:urease accessory protein